MAITSTRPRIALVKTRFRGKRNRTLAERTTVVGANAWKIAVEIQRHLEHEGFRFTSDRMATDVIAECLAFLVPLADRAVYGRLEEAARAEFVSGLARHVADTYANNLLDLVGPGGHREAFIEFLNRRSGTYAEFGYAHGEPDHGCLRYFASEVERAMAGAGNRWVVEQMMEVEAPEMARLMRKLLAQALDLPE